MPEGSLVGLLQQVWSPLPHLPYVLVIGLLQQVWSPLPYLPYVLVI